MNAETRTHANTAPTTAATPVRSGLTIQRKCSCGASAGLAGKCDDCEKKKLAAGALQKKLTVNEPGDAYEQEADRVAEGVMRMPAPVSAVSRNTAPAISRAATGDGGGAEAPAIVHDVLRSSGQPLDAGTRAFMEPRFGHDFSGVRVHTDARAAESARAVNALAYTVGKDVVFGEGQYAPGSGSGQRLLAHELTHVVQQGGGIRSNPINNNPTAFIEQGPRAMIPTAGSRGRVYVARQAHDNGTSSKNDEAQGGNKEVSPWEMGVDWLRGGAPIRRFTDGDQMTEELKLHKGISEARERVVTAVTAICQSNPDTKEFGDATGVKYSLTGISGVLNYLGDMSTLATLGLTGNLTVTFLGSYSGGWRATVNCCKGVGVVHFHVRNISGLTSGTRFPILGYDKPRPTVGDWLVEPSATFKQWGATLPGSLARNRPTGSMSTIEQIFDWDELIFFSPAIGCSDANGADLGRSRVLEVPGPEGVKKLGVSKDSKHASYGHNVSRDKAKAHRFRVAAWSFLSGVDCNPFGEDGQRGITPPMGEPLGGPSFRQMHSVEVEVRSFDGMSLVDGSARIVGSEELAGQSKYCRESAPAKIVANETPGSLVYINHPIYGEGVEVQRSLSTRVGVAVPPTIPGVPCGPLGDHFLVPYIGNKFFMQLFANGIGVSGFLGATSFPSHFLYENGLLKQNSGAPVSPHRDFDAWAGAILPVSAVRLGFKAMRFYCCDEEGAKAACDAVCLGGISVPKSAVPSLACTAHIERLAANDCAPLCG